MPPPVSAASCNRRTSIRDSDGGDGDIDTGATQAFRDGPSEILRFFGAYPQHAIQWNVKCKQCRRIDVPGGVNPGDKTGLACPRSEDRGRGNRQTGNRRAGVIRLRVEQFMDSRPWPDVAGKQGIPCVQSGPKAIPAVFGHGPVENGLQFAKPAEVGGWYGQGRHGLVFVRILAGGFPDFKQNMYFCI